jgi:hypothetical protein
MKNNVQNNTKFKIDSNTMNDITNMSFVACGAIIIILATLYLSGVRGGYFMSFIFVTLGIMLAFELGNILVYLKETMPNIVGHAVYGAILIMGIYFYFSARYMDDNPYNKFIYLVEGLIPLAT